MPKRMLQTLKPPLRRHRGSVSWSGLLAWPNVHTLPFDQNSLLHRRAGPSSGSSPLTDGLDVQPPGRTSRLTWYARRLGSMSPGEVLWRGSQAVGDRFTRPAITSRPEGRLLLGDLDWETVAVRFRSGVGRPVLLDRSRAQAIAERHPQHVASLVDAAERVRSGRVTYFGYPEVQLGEPVDWNLDPLRDFHWPSEAARRIDHRTVSADPKWIWELNRLQHLPWLAEAWLFTGDDGFAQLALDHLDSWLTQNPVGQGIAWRGAFEAGLRAISVAAALQGLRDCEALTVERLERSVRMLAASADLCWRQRSRFSSANNHLVGELAGLATVAIMFPELALAAQWEERALSALELEAERQILPDGAGAEQAVGYQVFTSELMLVVAVLLKARGSAPPAAITDAIGRSARYLAAVVGEHDPDPRYGDDDEGFALRLGPEPRRTVREHLGLVAALTKDEGARGAGTSTLSACWVEALVDPGANERAPENAPSQASFFAPDGGLVVLRAGGRRLTMDVAALGYLSIAAHGHADALSVTLSLDGEEVIGDPGAMSYYGHPRWREAARGTRGHGTVTVDGQDQSVSGGPFLWTRHARVRVRCVDLGRGIVDAEHDGYRRLPTPVAHRRWVSAPPQQLVPIVVVDEVSGVGEHEMRISWPLHPDLDVSPRPAGHVVTRRGRAVAQIVLVSSTSLVVDQVRADQRDHVGWWSDRLELRTPSWVVGGIVRGSAPLVAASIICRSDRGSFISDPEIAQDGDVVTVSWWSGAVHHAVVIDRSRDGAVERRGLAQSR